MAKRSAEKQAALEKYRAIALAKIDYFSKRDIGSFVCDDHDRMIDIYAGQRQRVQRYFDQRRLDGLERAIGRDFLHPELIKYIKQNTGYDVDDTEPVLPPVSSANDRVYTKTYEEGEVTVTHAVSISGRSVGKYDFDVLKSPNGLKRITINTNAGRNNSYTSIYLHFPNGSGAIFHTNLVSPEISVSWKDNQTIIIRTREEFKPSIRVSKVQSHGETVWVEYLEA